MNSSIRGTSVDLNYYYFFVGYLHLAVVKIL